MNLVERLEEAFEKKVGGTAMLPASDVLSASVELQRQEERIRALEAHNAVLRDVLETTHDLYAHASSGYGFARPDNPHNFSPDFECCSQEEIAAHSKACEDYDAGRKISNESWGIGTYCDEYAPALKALASTPEQSLSSIRRVERERCAAMAESPIGQKLSTLNGGHRQLAAAIRQMED